MDVNKVTLVTDERVCAKAIQGYAAMPGGRIPASLYVIKMGTKFFAIHDPTDLAGDMETVHIMDSKFVSVGGWTGS